MKKQYWYILTVLLIIATVIFYLRFDGCDRFFAGDIDVTNPPPPSEVGIPEEAEPVPMIEDRYTIAERVNPFHHTTRAEEITEGLPAGTEVYEVEGEGIIYRTQEGFIYKTGDLEIAAYKKPEKLIAMELRPKLIATTDFATAGLGVEIDVIRAGKFHAGPAVGINVDRSAWGGGGIGYNVWRNVDAGAFGGYGSGGATYGISIGIAIE